MTTATRQRQRLRRALRAAAILALAGVVSACDAPEDVLYAASEAARDGDRDTYAACFTPRSRAVLRTWWQAVDAENAPLGALGSQDVTVVSSRSLTSRQSDTERVVLTVSEGAERMRVVVHRLANVWRIDLFDTERAMTGLTSL